jgi:hypothetical protein
MAGQWIKSAIKHPGALTEQASSAGKSLDQYCSSPGISTKTKRRCALRKTLMGFNKK